MTQAAVPLFLYQKKWLLDRSRFKLGKFARQTGKTFTTTLEIVDDCYETESRGGRTRWVILSRGERQAKEAMDEGVKLHARAYGMALEELQDEFKGGSGESYKQLDVVFPGGSKITALPANPDTARGFSANVFLDEFAFHKDSREIWKALFPVISKGWKLRVTSTPNGKGNKFYELCEDKSPNNPWSRHIVDIYQAVADGLPRNIDELRAGLRDDDAWAQEFELQWLDEASAWLSYDLINSVEHDRAGDPKHYQGGNCFIGNDIGARKDLWCAWVWEQIGDVLWTREVVTRKRIKFSEQDAILDELVDRYRPARICMDQTGMGEKPVEDAKRRYGESRVEGVLFTSPAKQHLANLGKQAFEDRKVRIPLGDTDIRSDLHSLKKITTALGNVRFDVDGGDGHADRAWAAFLGIYAASNPAGAIEFESTGVKRAGANIEGFQSGTASPDIITDAGFGAVAGRNDFGGFS